MATRTCPQCGAQYVASVRRCIDCDVILTDPVEAEDDVELAGSTGEPLGEGDQIGYELDGWGNQLKVTLDGMLDRAGIRRVWEAGALVVSAADEEAVDDLIATLEGEEVLELDDDVERVAFEIEDLDADGQAELDARLLADGVPHTWTDEGELVVAAEDEGRVAAIIEGVLDGVDEEVDGLAAHEALSALYVSTDRLLKSPLDPKLGDAYAAAVAALEGLPVPYGFSTDAWAELCQQAEALEILVRGPEAGSGEEEGEGGSGSGAADEAEASAPAEAADGGEEAGEADEDGSGEGADEPDRAARARQAAGDLRTRLLDFV